MAATDEISLGDGIPVKDYDDGYVALEEKLDRLKATMDTIANSITPSNKEREIPDMLAPYHSAMVKSEVDPEIIHMVMEGVKTKSTLTLPMTRNTFITGLSRRSHPTLKEWKQLS